MTEISCRAYSFFAAAEQAGLCNIDELIEGLPLTREFIETPSNRAPWDAWAVLCDRFCQLFATQDEIFEVAKYAVNDSYSGLLARAPEVFVDEESIFRVGFRWVVPSLFHHVDFSLADVGPNAFTVSATLRPGFRESIGWFQLFAGTMPLVPAYIGLPPSDYEILKITPSKAMVLIRLKRKTRPMGWWKRFSRSKSLEDERLALRSQLDAAFGAMHGATESFRNLLDGMPAVVLAVKNHEVIYSNTTYEKLSRRSNVTDGAKIHDLFLEGDHGILDALFRDDLHEAPMLRLRTNDPKKTVVLSARMVRGVDFQGEPTDLLVGLDVTEDSITRTNLERSEATMSAMLRAQPELIFRLDNELRILDVKPGSDVEESAILTKLIGHSVADAFSAMPAVEFAELHKFFARLAECVTKGEAIEERVNAPSRSGQQRHMSVSSHPLLDGRESVIVVRDETSRTIVEQRLRVAERMASVGTLAAGIGHEINNPLAYVSMNVELLKEELGDLPQETRERIAGLLAGIADGTSRIQHIIQPLRQMSRIEARQHVEVSLKKSLDAALATTEHQRRHRIKLFLEIEDVPDVLGDPTEVVQVFVNLLVNAVNSMETPKEHGQHELRVRLFRTDKEVVVEIEDTGIGISKENLGTIFTPFFSTRMREAGTGLGLSIVHSIVTDMSGTIQVHSRVGHGSTFRVAFAPVEITPKVDVVVPVEPPKVQAPKRKAQIIVVDDEPMIRQSMARVLAKHEVTCFGSGSEALAYLNSHPKPDLVICDVTMPGMSGLELFSMLEASSPDVLDRLVFVTGGAFTAQTEQFLQRPDIRCLYKPVLTEVLRQLAIDSVENRKIKLS